jgi:hypothetical protein
MQGLLAACAQRGRPRVGLAKNLARAQTMFALTNLYLVRRQLLPAYGRCAL